MKDLITESITKQIQSALKSTNGASYTFGEVIDFKGQGILPVAKVKITLNADSSGGGGGNIDSSKGDMFGAANVLGGGGSGDASAGIEIDVVPIGFVSEQDGKPIFTSL